jgi:protein tyrosine/serine phosphatase
VVQVQIDKNLSKEEKIEKDTTEIVDLYKTRDGQPVVSKKKTLFDELWERDHPEEVKALKEKE